MNETRDDYFELPVWQRSHQLATTIFRLTRRIPDDEQRHLAEELRCTAADVPCCIVIGMRSGRSRETVSQLVRAADRMAETAYLLLLAGDLGYLHPSAVRRLRAESELVQHMLERLRAHLESTG